MGAKRQLVGLQMGDLRVLQKVNSKIPQYRCECVCGKRITVKHSRLIHTNSPKTHCGCQRRGLPTRFKVEYHCWHNAIERCHNPNHHGYPRYGAKGIKVCERWRNSFETFLRDMGPRPSNHSIDRIDPKGDYELSNVRWADNKTQARNKKDTKWVKHPKTGKPVRAADLADELDIRYQTMRANMIEEGTW